MRTADIPWRKMMDFRNKLIHDYFGLDLSLIWKTAIEDVPPLLHKIEALVAHETNG